MRFTNLTLALGMALLLGGCATEPGDTPGDAPADTPGQAPAEGDSLDAPPEELTGAWRLVRAVDAAGVEARPESVPFTMQIAANGTATGRVACNSWNSQVDHVDRDRLRFGAIGATYAGCDLRSRELQTLEQSFSMGITRWMEWSAEDDTLHLEFQDGAHWQLERFDPDADPDAAAPEAPPAFEEAQPAGDTAP